MRELNVGNQVMAYNFSSISAQRPFSSFEMVGGRGRQTDIALHCHSHSPRYFYYYYYSYKAEKFFQSQAKSAWHEVSSTQNVCITITQLLAVSGGMLNVGSAVPASQWWSCLVSMLLVKCSIRCSRREEKGEGKATLIMLYYIISHAIFIFRLVN